MNKKLYDGIGCWSYILYFVIWLGGTALSYWVITNKEHIEIATILFMQVAFFSFARIAYLEDLLKEVEKRLNGG